MGGKATQAQKYYQIKISNRFDIMENTQEITEMKSTLINPGKVSTKARIFQLRGV